MNDKNLKIFALVLRIAGLCIILMDLYMQSNPHSTIYYYIPFLFVVLELLLFTGREFFHQTTWVYASHGLIYYVILVLAYTIWTSYFSDILAGIYLAGFTVYFILNKKEENRLQAKKRKY